MEKLWINEELENIACRVTKYKTSNEFLNENLVICEIDKNTILQQVFDKMRAMRDLPIYSLQFLVSEAYDHVITNHKMTLLLHIVDGIYDKKRLVNDRSEIRKKYRASQKGKIGDYMAAVYWLCNNYFFKYHRKFGCEILPLLKVTQYEFLERLSDTRNWYSHFLNNMRKVSRIKNGKEFIIYFELVCYMICLSIIDELKLFADEDKIKEFYYTVHDWILAIIYDRDSPLKSKTYKIAKSCEEFRSMSEKIQKERSTDE